MARNYGTDLNSSDINKMPFRPLVSDTESSVDDSTYGVSKPFHNPRHRVKSAGPTQFRDHSHDYNRGSTDMLRRPKMKNKVMNSGYSSRTSKDLYSRHGDTESTRWANPRLQVSGQTTVRKTADISHTTHREPYLEDSRRQMDGLYKLELKNELDTVKEDLKWYKQQYSDMRGRLQIAENELYNQREKLRKRSTATTGKLTHDDETIAKLVQNVRELNEIHKKHVLDSELKLNNERTLFEQELTREKSKVTELEEKLRQAERETNLRTSKATTGRMTQDDLTIANLKASVRELNEINTKHVLEKYEFKKQVREAKQMAFTRETEKNTLNDELQALRERLRHLEHVSIEDMAKTSQLKTGSSAHIKTVAQAAVTATPQQRQTGGFEDSRLQKQLQEKDEEIQRLQQRNAAIVKQKDRTIADLSDRPIYKDATGKDYTVTELWEQVQALRAELQVKNRELENNQKSQDRVTTDVSQLQKELNDKNILIEKLEKEKSSMERKSNRLIGEIEDRKTEEESRLQKQLQKKGEEIQHLQQRNVAIVKQKDRTIADLTERLSAEMETKIAADESALENISIKSRPMTIATDYELLCSSEWLSAKQALDSHSVHMTEEKKLRLLCKILIVGLDTSNEVRKQCVEALTLLVQHPGGNAKALPYSGTVRSVATKIETALLNVLRLNAEQANITPIAENIIEMMKTETTDSAPLHSARFMKYIQAVARIAWKMSIQRPPMVLDKSGEGQMFQGVKRQNVFWNSSDPESQSSRVKFYIHPALYHGDLLMVKGRVFLYEKSSY